MPNTLVKTQPFFKISPCLQQRILFKFNQTYACMGFMDYIIPDLSMAYNITFDESVMKQNLKRSTAINIRTKFVPKYREFFSDSVLENWSRWFDREQKLWSPQGIVCATSTLVLPRAMPPLLDLNQLCPAAGLICTLCAFRFA